MIKTEANPEGMLVEVFDEIGGGVATDRSRSSRDLRETFYGADREGSAVSQGTRDAFWL
ncbi:hypothetical protein [Streptomyces fagopyri]|uniref:hypothetical protein n=1 Tax=Streptomyces fagopyri TaxID=2662397 RepID=UPI0033D2B08F